VDEMAIYYWSVLEECVPSISHDEIYATTIYLRHGPYSFHIHSPYSFHIYVLYFFQEISS